MKIISYTFFIALTWIISDQVHEVKGVPPNGLPNAAVAGVRNTAGTSGSSLLNITYHGGPVMPTPVSYVIWYGSWAGNTGVAIIEYFLQNIGAHPWWGMTKAYNQTSNIVFGQSTTDNYSQGSNLNQTLVLAIVKRAITLGNLPNDTNGIYFVFTSADIACGTFCSTSCGWHNYDLASQLIFSFVGNAARCPSTCGEQTRKSPNNNIGADAMVNTIAHEASEATTDPFFNGWYDSNGNENADKCGWTFGTKLRAPNGAYYNMDLFGTKYLVQQNWRLPTQDCGMS